MSRRALFLLCGLVLLPALLIAQDVLERYGLDRVQVENSTLGALNGWYGAPDMDLLKALPPAERAGAVNALGAYLKQYVRSAPFQAQYAKAYRNSKPRSGGFLPPLNARALLSKGIEKATKKDAPGDAHALDKDPNVTLRRRLQSFLDATGDVDFEAATTGEGTSRRFVDPANEARPPEWKMCFRAGPEATAAARSFAKQWLSELGAK